jgi:hypothetical protein
MKREILFSWKRVNKGKFTGIYDDNGVKIFKNDPIHCWGGTEWNGMFEYDYHGICKFIDGLFVIVVESNFCVDFEHITHVINEANQLKNSQGMMQIRINTPHEWAVGLRRSQDRDLKRDTLEVGLLFLSILITWQKNPLTSGQC